MINFTFLSISFFFRGTYERWYYHSKDGICKQMNYTGCHGNANRFLTQEECENSCKHEAKLIFAQTKCTQSKMEGRGSKLLAKWYFNSREKTCQPFYYFGEGGNENKFDSWDECEAACPNAYPPELIVVYEVSTQTQKSFFVLSQHFFLF